MKDPKLIQLKMDFESLSALFFIVKWERDVDVLGKPFMGETPSQTCNSTWPDLAASLLSA